jgi:hypothetical protein
MREGGQRRRGTPVKPDSRSSAPFSPAPSSDDSAELVVCRFLASETADGALAAAIPAVDPNNRCVALGVPTPQFPQQQHLVCLTAGHVDCPRYLRGLLIASMPPEKPAREPISPAVIAATLVLLAAIAASFGFLAVRGGFDLAVADVEPSSVAAAPVASPSAASILTPAPSAFQSSAPGPTSSASPSPTPTTAPTPTPRPTPKPTPRSDRYAVLTACPSTPNCWIYVIRAGDNLRSIANWFGVSYDRIRAMNPNLRIPIHPGDRLRIPTPTR